MGTAEIAPQLATPTLGLRFGLLTQPGKCWSQRGIAQSVITKARYTYEGFGQQNVACIRR